MIQARNVDLSTLIVATSSSSPITIDSNNKTVLSIIAPENGKYYITGLAGLFGSGNAYAGIYLLNGSTEFAKNYSNFYNDRSNLSLGVVTTLDAGDTINLQLSCSGGGQAQNMNREYSLFMVRVS